MNAAHLYTFFFGGQIGPGHTTGGGVAGPPSKTERIIRQDDLELLTIIKAVLEVIDD